MNDFQQKVIYSLANHAPVWMVGGVVRDSILGIDVKDIDLVTPLSAADAQSILNREGLFPKKIGKNFETLSVFEQDSRIDIVHIDSLEEDAQTRDFTINAIYQDPITNLIINPLSGREDLDKKILKTCGCAHQRFTEDPVRILRMVRFAVQYDMVIEQQGTWEKGKELIPLLSNVSRERITSELAKVLILDHAEKAVIMLSELGYWDMFVPELARLKGISQNKYHAFDVWDHTLAVFRNTPSDLFLRLAGLFHDIGKWEVASRECYVRGELRVDQNNYYLNDYKIISTRSGKELDHKIKPFIGKELIIVGARLDHYPDTVQFKRVTTDQSLPLGLTYKENGKRHFLNHEKASSRLLKEILKRYSFSMFFDGGGHKREEQLLKLVDNHMLATLTFMPELRNENSKRSFRERAAELTWHLCWDGRDFSLQSIHDFVLLCKADYKAKKVHSDEENKKFDMIFKELILVGLWQNDNLDQINWDAFYKYAVAKGLRGPRLGRYKEMIRTRAMIQMNTKLDKIFLDKVKLL